MKTIIFTQEDSFFIPRNIAKVIAKHEVCAIVNNDHKSSLMNRPMDFVKWFGWWQTFKMGMNVISRKAAGVFDALSGYRLHKGECSVKATAKKHGVPYLTVSNINDPAFVEQVRALEPDIIVSFSAPQVIKDELLGVPKHGIINVHCSLLPEYRGCLPSFWHLYNSEPKGGATVHYMSKAIDDGDIILQRDVDISDCRTMFEHIGRTKQLAGEVILEAMEQIENGTAVRTHNDTTKGEYFTWPTKEQAREFKKRGKRLI